VSANLDYGRLPIFVLQKVKKKHFLLLGSYVGDNKTFYLTKKDLSQSAKMAYLIVFSLPGWSWWFLYSLCDKGPLRGDAMPSSHKTDNSGFSYKLLKPLFHKLPLFSTSSLPARRLQLGMATHYKLYAEVSLATNRQVSRCHFSQLKSKHSFPFGIKYTQKVLKLI